MVYLKAGQINKTQLFCDSEFHTYAIIRQIHLSDDHISVKLRVTEKYVLLICSTFRYSYCFYILFNKRCKKFQGFPEHISPLQYKLTRDLASVRLVWD